MHWRKQKIVRGTVLYESFSGNGMLCNPEAIFRALLDTPDMAHLKHIWVLSDLEAYASTIEEFKSFKNVRFVQYETEAYYKALATSEYLINNATFPWQFSKRDGQTYVNTWHGTPLKRMGYDIDGGGPDTRNVVRNFLHADYLLSANRFMTEQMYITGYRLNNVFRGTIIEEGYPRIDRQTPDSTDRRALTAALATNGIVMDERKIILYAPTWKGQSFYAPANDALRLKRTVEELESHIDTSRYRVLLKTHQVVYEAMSAMPELRQYLVPNDVPTNVVLGATGILITDYSSIFFDYLATGNPIFFHLPDVEDYSSARGLYLRPDELPGPVSRTVAELGEQIGRAFTDADPEALARRGEAVRTYCSKEDGAVSARIIDIVFRGRTDGYSVQTEFRDGRETILMYIGGMSSNGITTSVLNLLDNIDYSRFDVTAFYSFSRAADKARNARQINEHVRLLPRQGWINTDRITRIRSKRQTRRGNDTRLPIRPIADHVWADEWRRCFGESRFDRIVDFSGYGPFWDHILLQGSAQHRSIWLHNDVMADSQRTVDGEKPLERGLNAVFRTYRQFDSLVSVSEDLSRVNAENLAEYADASKFTSAVNAINPSKVLRKAYGRYDRLPSAEASVVAEEEQTAAGPAQPETELPDLVEGLSRQYSMDDIAAEVDRRQVLDRIMDAPAHVQTFVTVGRLSPEKNHARLIRAFNRVHATAPDTRLVIIGSGPLSKDLRDLAAELGLGDAVRFAGQQTNPYALLAASDCFVMSSDYEGQPMVILEARLAGLPIVSTAFGSANSAVPPGTGLIVEQDDDALADGMEAYLRGEVPVLAFDGDEYNERALGEFYAAIGEPAEASNAGIDADSRADEMEPSGSA